jgi:membrane protein DedA with SNARE-associated domain
LAEFIATYGVWLVAGFIVLETIGAPLPAEAALMAAGIFARTQGLEIWSLIIAGIVAAILGNVAGYWIGKRFGRALLLRYGPHVGLTDARIRIGQWLFEHYGGRFVFIARFLPFLRNMAAVLAGTNAMPQHVFYLASTVAAVVWVVGYSLAAYSLGEAFMEAASPAAIVLGLAAVAIILAVPALIVRYERRLLARIEREPPAEPGSETTNRKTASRPQ